MIDTLHQNIFCNSIIAPEYLVQFIPSLASNICTRISCAIQTKFSIKYLHQNILCNSHQVWRWILHQKILCNSHIVSNICTKISCAILTKFGVEYCTRLVNDSRVIVLVHECIYQVGECLYQSVNSSSTISKCLQFGG